MKNIFDYSHIKSVSALVLIDKDSKELRGKIICNWSDNPNGSVCTSQVFHYFESDKLIKKQGEYKTEFLKGKKFDSPLIGKASGYGYDKLSSAIGSAIYNNTTERPIIDFKGVGLSGVEKWYDRHFNIEVIQVI